jgi:Arc/MetJ-type ribon-helix-helix transcriptional regulator
MVQRQKLPDTEGLQAAVRLSKSDFTKIQHLVDAGLYRSFADFLREAVRDKLASMEIVSVNAVKPEEAEHMIEDYLAQHPGPSFASEIADALGLEFDITFKTINRLLEEGRIKKAKK